MAVVVSPWPSDPAALPAARACVREAIGTREADLPDARLDQMAETASAIIQDYAPGAPDPIRSESLFRLVGYIWGSDFGGVASETLGPSTLNYTTNHADFARRSGALGLLSRWRIRRAGAAD